MNALIGLIFIAAIVVIVVVAIIVYGVVQDRANDKRELVADRQLLRDQLRVAKTELNTISSLGGENALGASLALDQITRLQEQHDNKQEELTR